MSGLHCDGQVLVTHDLLGLFDRFTPKFVKRYANLSAVIREAASAYVDEVKEGRFPGAEQTVAMPPEEFAKLKDAFGG